MGISQARIAEYLGVDKSSVSKLMAPNGVAITLDHLEHFTALLQRSAAEFVADADAVIQPVSPIEAQVLGRIREMTEGQRLALLSVLDWQRFATSRPRRPKGASVSGDDDALLTLFHTLDPDPSAQDAVLAVLRAHPLVRARVIEMEHASPQQRRQR